jgi:DNA replication protein DnaC
MVNTMNECEKAQTCKHVDNCPNVPVPGKENTVRRCPLYQSLIAEKRAKQIVRYSYEPPDRLPRWTDFEYDINEFDKKIDIVRSAARSGCHILIIYGNNGTGKTMVLQALLFQLVQDSRSVFYCESKLLKLFATEEWDLRSKIYNEHFKLRELARDAQILLIDDLGNEQPTENYETYLRGLLDGATKTVIATNYNKARLFERFTNPATQSRLSGAMWLPWIGTDYRTLRGER